MRLIAASTTAAPQSSAAASYSRRFDYEQAAITLERVVEPYRNDELRELLDRVRAQQVEMLTLVAEIRRDVAEKRTEGLLPKVEELLRLKPDHAQGQSLLEKLRPLEHKRKLHDREIIYQAAAKCLARYDYAAALESLLQIDAEVRTPQLVKLIDDTRGKADEAAWLVRDLSEAVIYDEHLLAVAERLIKLRPGDAEVIKLADRLRKRETAAAPAGNAKDLWPKPPAESIWGPPLETITHFSRIDVSSLDSESLKNPAEFCVAAGLALQGLGQARLRINLFPPEKSGLLSLLKSRTRKKPKAAWGIDVGRAALRRSHEIPSRIRAGSVRSN